MNLIMACWKPALQQEGPIDDFKQGNEMIRFISENSGFWLLAGEADVGTASQVVFLAQHCLSQSSQEMSVQWLLQGLKVN